MNTRRDEHGWPVDLPPLRVQWDGWRGRLVTENVGGEKETEMGNNDRDRDRGRSDSNGPKQLPWDLFRIVQILKRGEPADEWVKCGAIWKMKDREGFTWTQHFAIPEGARMAAAPRPRKDDDR